MKFAGFRSGAAGLRSGDGDRVGWSARRRLRSKLSVMTQSRGLKISATVALLLVAGTACADNGNDATTPATSPTVSATPTTVAPSPSPTNASALAAAQATAMLRRYYDVRGDLRQHPKRPLSRLSAVAISTELAADRTLISHERQLGLRQVGTTGIAKLEVQGVDLDNSDPKAGKVPTVAIDVCADVSHVDIVDKSGKSTVSPTRPDTAWLHFLVSNYIWHTDPNGGWRVASSQDLERTPCAAS